MRHPRGFLIIPGVLGVLLLVSVGFLVGSGGKWPDLSFGNAAVEKTSVTVSGSVITRNHKKFVKVPSKTVTANGRTVTLPGRLVPFTVGSTLVDTVSIPVTGPPITITKTGPGGVTTITKPGTTVTGPTVTVVRTVNVTGPTVTGPTTTVDHTVTSVSVSTQTITDTSISTETVTETVCSPGPCT